MFSIPFDWIPVLIHNLNDMKWELPSYQESVEAFKEREGKILEKLTEEAETLARTFMDFPPHGLKIAKRCINEGMQVDLNTALKLDVAIAAEEGSTPTAEANKAEGRAAFREKRKPVYKAE